MSNILWLLRCLISILFSCWAKQIFWVTCLVATFKIPQHLIQLCMPLIYLVVNSHMTQAQFNMLPPAMPDSGMPRLLTWRNRVDRRLEGIYPTNQEAGLMLVQKGQLHNGKRNQSSQGNSTSHAYLLERGDKASQICKRQARQMCHELFTNPSAQLTTYRGFVNFDSSQSECTWMCTLCYGYPSKHVSL